MVPVSFCLGVSAQGPLWRVKGQPGGVMVLWKSLTSSGLVVAPGDAGGQRQPSLEVECVTLVLARVPAGWSGVVYAC